VGAVSFAADWVLSLSLVPDEMEQLRRAAQACVDRDLVRDPEGFVTQAQRSASSLPDVLVDRLKAFRRYTSPTAGLLVRGLPVFDVPPTPPDPRLAVGPTLAAAGVLGIVCAVVGDQYGFAPELDGHIIQDILPVRGFEQTQQSISSDAVLDTHVELAFADDDYRADALALLCLRADHDQTAGTTLSSIDTMLPLLSRESIATLRQPRFRTTVDMSFLRGIGRTEPIYVGPIRVLCGSAEHPLVRADFAETSGIDDDAQRALDELRDAAQETAIVVHLAAGDLLLIDNHRAFHGRTPFRARWDGADRWLLRTSIARDLARSRPYRPGDRRVVDLDYAAVTKDASTYDKEPVT
jgi:L-asparagine oxygenase